MPSADTSLTPTAMLTTSDQLLREVVPGASGLWPRATAFLIRMALEQAISEFLATAAPGIESCPMRAQLLCLRGFVDREVAGQADAMWAVLSRACHYHAYDLPPTSTELREWHSQVTELCNSIGGRDDGMSASGQDQSEFEVSESDTLDYRRYRYSEERGAWIATQVAATGREPRVWTEEQARGRERDH